MKYKVELYKTVLHTLTEDERLTVWHSQEYIKTNLTRRLWEKKLLWYVMDNNNE